MNIIERSKALIREQHPGMPITQATDLSSLLGTTFPEGTYSVMVIAGERAWHVFWYQGRSLVLAEEDMGTLRVERVRQRLLEPVEALLIQAQHSILHERERRKYAVAVGRARRSYGIAGVPMPEGLEAYVAETTCTVHERPCLWADWAFHLPDGTFRVVLMTDLTRPGMLLEESVRALFTELQEAMREAHG